MPPTKPPPLQPGEIAPDLKPFLGDLVIVLIQRLGGDVLLPTSEMDHVPIGKAVLMEASPDGKGIRLKVVGRH